MNNLYLNNYRNSKETKKENKKENKKFKFSEKKEKTITSLNEIEHFLRNFSRFKNYIKLYKILK